MGDAGPDRVVSLDLIRGFAVLGILIINIPGFAGPTGATLSPHVPSPGGFADELVFAAGLVLFEGKMRALFTLLFGASMLLFIDRAEAAGRDGDVLQLRRLAWLALFGCLHFFLFWWGDILFSFAAIGIIALFMREMPARALVVSALIIFAGWSLGGTATRLPDVLAEERVRSGEASQAERARQAEYRRLIADSAARELVENRSGFIDQAAAKLRDRPLGPFDSTWPNAGETLPLMLIGMVLYRTGFFTGGWTRRRLRWTAAIGTASGLAATGLAIAWLWPRHFPPQAMAATMIDIMAIPHLAMALGYAALLVLATPRFAGSSLGRCVIAAGRTAFSNYIGTTILMTAIFYGWGFGLVGRLDRTEQCAAVLLGWAVMLGWSRPWLARFRQGPLEWLWRSLAEKRRLPFRR